LSQDTVGWSEVLSFRRFDDAGFTDLVTRSSSELDLRDPAAVEGFFAA
jgi:hypothetical protein